MNEISPQLLVCADSLLPLAYMEMLHQEPGSNLQQVMLQQGKVLGVGKEGEGRWAPGSGLTDAPWRLLDESVLKLKLAAKAIG